MSTRRYWFPAKRFGWGWGPPTCWQGWTVIGLYVALMLAGIPLVSIQYSMVAYVLYAMALSVVLVVVCWLTGEPPRWRWGDR